MFICCVPSIKYGNYDDVEWMRSQMDERIRSGMNNNGFELLTWADVGWLKFLFSYRLQEG